MPKEKNPDPAGTGRGAKNRITNAPSFIERRPYPPAEIRGVNFSEEFFLHVDPDTGGEVRLSRERYRLQFHALHVVVIDGWEVTITRNLFQSCGAGYQYVPIPPRGADWEMFDNNKDKITTWRRRAVWR